MHKSNNTQRICKKNLFKTTYNNNAFTEGNMYEIVGEDAEFYFIIDNEGNKFTMHKTPHEIYYFIDDYFYP